MERRTNVREPVDFLVHAVVDGRRVPARAVDLSSTGMVVCHDDALVGAEGRDLELHLDDGETAMPVSVRTVWNRDNLRGVSFVGLHDVDRLTLAEHIDRVVRRRTKAA